MKYKPSLKCSPARTELRNSQCVDLGDQFVDGEFAAFAADARLGEGNFSAGGRAMHDPDATASVVDQLDMSVGLADLVGHVLFNDNANHFLGPFMA